MKAKEIAKELVEAYQEAVKNKDSMIFSKKVAQVISTISVGEVQHLIKARSVKTDEGLLPILKEQRQKFFSVCAEFQRKTGIYDLLTGSDFDKGIKVITPEIYDWYVKNVIN